MIEAPLPPRRRSVLAMACAGVLILAGAGVIESARADRIGHPGAVFSGLDKITGRIISFEVAADETVQFGTLQITERACYTRPATEAPQTTTFVEVDEVDAKSTSRRIFSGWMFAASPGLHGIEHPVYDIWLTDCKGGGEAVAGPGGGAEANAPPENAKPAPEKPASKPRRVQPQKPQPPVDNFGAEPIEVGPPPGREPAAGAGAHNRPR